MTTLIENTTLDLGNNESAVIGIFPQADGTFLAMTSTASKEYKTRRGAVRWMAQRGVEILTQVEADLKKATEFGKLARRNETATAPCQCANMMGMIKEMSDAQAGVPAGFFFSLPLLKAWSKGFDKEHHTIANKTLADSGFFNKAL